MREILNENFYKKLSYDKIKINWNKNPVEMKRFLSFLKVEVERNKDYYGRYTGWTQMYNKGINLIIGGGIVGGVELLNDLQYGKNLDNQYNNYVSPFFLFNIMTEEGKLFFVNYYKEEIDALVNEWKEDVVFTEKSLIKKKGSVGKYSR